MTGSGNCVGRWLTLLLGLGIAGCFGDKPSDLARHKSDRGDVDGPVTPIPPPQNDPESVTRVKPPTSPFRFENVAEGSGIRFKHHSPLTEERHTHLVYGSGLGWFDFDRDGRPDLYCCQGATYAVGEPSDGNPLADGPSNLLFRNRQNASFVDVTQAAGLLDRRYSMAIAAADYDNDGFVDLCVTAYEENVLYHNNGDGTFDQVELPLQTHAGRLSTGCAWADVDADGNLDLFIANYARLGPDDYPVCEHTEAGKTLHIVCHPHELEAMPDLLFRNCGDGRFADMSAEAGITVAEAQTGLGAVAADLDHDGDIDIYVANDARPNHLWENQGGGTFVDVGQLSGTALNRHGAREAGMGIAIGDIDRDGRFDFLVTNFYNETNTLYRNEGAFFFSDVTDEMGLGAASRPRLSFGPCSVDFDNDGWLDLLTVNGHVHDRLHEFNRNEPFAQAPQIFQNAGGTRFHEVSAGSGGFFTEPRVGRGVAVADYDRDGDADVAVNHLNGPAALLRNDTPDVGGWLQIELIGTQSNREGIGAVITIDLGQQALVRCRQASTSYFSCDEGRLLVGVGNAERLKRVSIRWPSGREECWEDVQVNTYRRFVEGAGSEIVSPPEAEGRG